MEGERYIFDTHTETVVKSSSLAYKKIRGVNLKFVRRTNALKIKELQRINH